jgi:outer membrane protein assembly complex protein YaeT
MSRRASCFPFRGLCLALAIASHLGAAAAQPAAPESRPAAESPGRDGTAPAAPERPPEETGQETDEQAGAAAGDEATGPADRRPAPPPPAVRGPLPAADPLSREPEEGMPGAVDATIGDRRPPVGWKSWEVEGRLLDPVEVVRGFLEPRMERFRAWTDSQQRELIEYCLRLGYYATIRNQPSPEGGLRAVIKLEPVTLVRYVDVRIPWLSQLRQQTLFRDEIRRRMALRAGTPLALDEVQRQGQLRSEAERIADFLRNEGFFEARVDVIARPDGPYSVVLVVEIDHGAPYTVGKVTVVDSTAIDPAVITAMFKHHRVCLVQLCWGEKRFSRQQLNQDIQKVVKLYQKLGYPGARVRSDFDVRHSFKRETKTVEFTIFVRERRKIDVVFRGNERLSDQELRGALTFAEEGSYDEVEVDASAGEIRRKYQKLGFFEAAATWERQRFGFFERILYDIEEGARLKVREITFEGNQAFTGDELRRVITTRPYPTGVFHAFQAGGYVTSSQLRLDRERIAKLYASRGFRDTRVQVRLARERRLLDNSAALAAAVASDLPSDGLYINFVVDEGPQTLVEKVEFSFAVPPSRSVEELSRVISLRAGEPLVDARLRADSDALRSHYFGLGFPRAEVVASTVPGSTRDQVVVIYSVTEHSMARIGKVALRGNFRTRGWVLLEELDLDEGALLTASTAAQARNNLRRSELFQAVKVDYLGLEDRQQEVVNALVTVEERERAELQIGGGWSTDNKWFTELGGTLRNLLGAGIRLSSRLQYGLEIQSIDAQLVSPSWIQEHFLGTSFVLELDGFRRTEATERFGPLRSIGFSTAAAKEGRHGFWEGWLLGLRFDFRTRTRDEELVRSAGASDDIARTPVSTRTATIGPRLIIDRRRDRLGRRNPLAPEQGYRIDLSSQFSDPAMGSSARYLKLGMSGQTYLKLGRRMLLSSGLRYDHGVPMGGAVVLPEVERFFAGGDTTVRGFEEDRLATEIIAEPVYPAQAGLSQFRVLPAGGNIRFLHNVDLQVSVWNQPPLIGKVGGSLASAIFLDTGIVTNSLHGFQLRDLRHSVGLAFARILTQLGSLSFEYAVPLDPALGDNPRGRLHINFGFLF